MPIRWDEGARRYRDARGRFIPRRAIVDALEAARDVARARGVALSEGLVAGRVSLPEWQIQMRDQIKALHLLSAGIAGGGKAQLSPAALGRIGAETRKQYAYLNRFARQIANGEQPLNGRVPQRAALYFNATRATFAETERRQQKHAGNTEARRRLHARESCAGCVAEAARGWLPTDEVAPIGSQECRSNCLCTVEYRKGDVVER